MHDDILGEIDNMLDEFDNEEDPEDRMRNRVPLHQSLKGRRQVYDLLDRKNTEEWLRDQFEGEYKR